MKILRNLLCAVVLASAALSHVCQAQGQYPSRPITLLVPWVAGGGSDIALRALAESVGKQLGQRVVVENKPGIGGALDLIDSILFTAPMMFFYLRFIMPR